MNGDRRQATAGVAIVGMACRFPGADDLRQFWRNLRDGVESISFFSSRELAAEGIDPAVLDEPDYVPARGVLEDIDRFDASLFGISPRDAELTDPQHRLFLECSWHALEDAAIAPDTYPGLIGVFASSTMNTYLPNNLRGNPELAEFMANQAFFGNDKDFVATKVSYHLALSGPSVNVQTACSSSLVGTCLACQALLDYQCDAALAGGVSLLVPHKSGYRYREGGVTSRDGHCRAFDADASGGVLGSGAGVVVLKRLEDAVADGDRIYAVVTGSAINNDGSAKAGFTAPGVRGQAEVIAMAQAMAEVGPEAIDYVETHGSATLLGDAVEISALARAFGNSADCRCLLGSVKTNIGHLDAAAGIAGLIKTALAVWHGELPPSLYFKRPNPRLQLDRTPFEICAKRRKWPVRGERRRAGVSSFGIGGSNAHVIVEEAPPIAASGAGRRCQLLLLSANSDSALETMSDHLAAHLADSPRQELADVAFTLHLGRPWLKHRRILVCRDRQDAIESLRERRPERLLSAVRDTRQTPVTFMFSGLGDHYVDMGLGLYRHEEGFRREIDRCAELLRDELETDLRTLLYPRGTGSTARAPVSDDPLRALLGGRGKRRDAAPLDHTRFAQPAVFALDYALAKLWMEWGVQPHSLIGYSLGEYVAARLADVLSLEDALHLVAGRARLIDELPEGAMLAVSRSEQETSRLLPGALAIAAVNGPQLTVVAGPEAEVAALERRLTDEAIACRRLPTTHAFHTPALEPIVDRFSRLLEEIELRPPQLPILSNVSGTWLSPDEARDPETWRRHLLQPVRFGDGLRELWREPDRILLEVGPGQALSSLALQQAPPSGSGVVLRSLRSSYEPRSDDEFLLTELGRLWLNGGAVDGAGFYRRQRRRRVGLPSYPFERQSYWIAPPERSADDADTAGGAIRKAPPSDWFYLPSWHRAPRPAPSAEAPAEDPGWLVFADRRGLGEALAARLSEVGWRVITVLPGTTRSRTPEGWDIDPRRPEDYEALLREVRERGEIPRRIAHLWSLEATDPAWGPAERFAHQQDLGFYSLIYLARALSRIGGTENRIEVVSEGLHAVREEDEPVPGRATLLAPCRVIPQEFPNLSCRSIDLSLPSPGTDRSWLVDALVDEFESPQPLPPEVAYRGRRRWLRKYLRWPLDEPSAATLKLRRGGVYLITGGLGNVGRTLSEYLTTALAAAVILTGRSGLPPRERWDNWLDSHDAEDRTSAAIRCVRRIESAGGRVLTRVADVADEAQMRAVVSEVRERWGALHGVFHAAGVLTPDAFRAIQQTTTDDCERHFASKVYGCWVLERVLDGLELDFCHVFSSTSTVLGGLGFGAYAAANLYADAWVRRHNRRSPVPWSSANWDTWRPAGRAISEGGLGASVRGLSMSPEESLSALRRVMSLRDVDRVVVSLGDLDRRMKQWLNRPPDSERTPPPAGRSKHSRPRLETPYVAPSGEVESTLVGIWSDLLGVDSIGVHDNFFQLGGHSLLAIQVVSRIRASFGVEVPVNVLFEAPTIRELDRVVERLQVALAGDEQVAEILLELESEGTDVADDEKAAEEATEPRVAPV